MAMSRERFGLNRWYIDAFTTTQTHTVIYPFTRDVVRSLLEEGRISQESYDAYILLLNEYISKLELVMLNARSQSSKYHRISHDSGIINFGQGAFDLAKRRFGDPSLFIVSFGRFLQQTREKLYHDTSPASFTEHREKFINQVELAIGVFERVHRPTPPTPPSPQIA